MIISGKKGFSLIELMIVVAIIGILSAIAIPNFQRFQMKSRQSEAKNALAAIYQAEKAYHQEWAQYFADFKDIGFAPEGVVRYSVHTAATAAPISPTAISGYMGPSGPVNVPTNYNNKVYCDRAAVANYSVCTKDGDFITAAVQTAGDANAAVMTINTFRAAATSDLDRDGVAGLGYDAWRMTDDKSLTNYSNDAAND